MFLGVLNTVFLDISNYLPHLELRNRSVQIVVRNFIIISSVGIKRFDCICTFRGCKTQLDVSGSKGIVCEDYGSTTMVNCLAHDT